MSRESYNLFRGQLLASNMKFALKALSVAEDAHKGVLRKDGVTPYVEHPVKVASMLYSAGIRDDKILAAAILHDVIEDTQVDAFEIYAIFKLISHDETAVEEIVETVKCVTKPKKYDNCLYYGNIKENAGACLIKMADRAHNLSTLTAFSEAKKAEYLRETEEHVYFLIKYAQHHYPEYADAYRIFDLWIKSIINNLKPYVYENTNINF